MEGIRKRIERLEKDANTGMPFFLVTFFDGKKEVLSIIELWQIAWNVYLGHDFEDHSKPSRPYKEYMQVEGIDPVTYANKMIDIIEQEKGETERGKLAI